MLAFWSRIWGVLYSDDCIDWYLVTTITYADGSSNISEVYLYTSCDGGGGGGTTGPGCGDGSVGLGDDDDTPVATTFPWRVATNPDGEWYVESYENFQGVRSSACESSGGGYFTSIDHNHSTVFNLEAGLSTWAEQYCNTALSGTPATAATSKVDGKLSFSFTEEEINSTGRFTYHLVFP
jgi:hypothetical protein